MEEGFFFPLLGKVREFYLLTYYFGVLQSRKVSVTSKFTSEYSVSGSLIFIYKRENSCS